MYRYIKESLAFNRHIPYRGVHAVCTRKMNVNYVSYDIKLKEFNFLESMKADF